MLTLAAHVRAPFLKRSRCDPLGGRLYVLLKHSQAISGISICPGSLNWFGMRENEKNLRKCRVVNLGEQQQTAVHFKMEATAVHETSSTTAPVAILWENTYSSYNSSSSTASPPCL